MAQKDWRMEPWLEQRKSCAEVARETRRDTLVRALGALLLVCALLAGFMVHLAHGEWWNESCQPARPSHSEHAKVSRWLVSRNRWGVLATSGIEANKDVEAEEMVVPFANVVSFSDGTEGDTWVSTGSPYFLLTSMDPTPRDLAKNPWATLTVSELMQGRCEKDAEDPTCWRVSLIGKVMEVTEDVELAKAKSYLFSKHKEMATWPDDHGFKVFKMEVSKLFLLDWYGGAHFVQTKDYFAAQLKVPDHCLPHFNALPI